MKKRDAADDETQLLRDNDTDTIKHKKKKNKEEKTNGSIKEENDNPCTKKPTVTIAVAGSIIDNAQSLELATLLAGQIARAATIFRIDEVVVFDNIPSSSDDGDSAIREKDSNYENESGAKFLVRILQYLETPQYLRRCLFPMHGSLKFVGILPPLDAPHHVHKHEWCPFREGVTLERNPSNSKGTNVDVGSSKNGYDYKIGTSEHGLVVSSSRLIIPSFRHQLIVFGGLAGLEECIEEDNNLKGKSVNEVFDSYLNTCPLQGSRTIRTEEAVFISLQYFQDPTERVEQQPERKY